MKLDRYESSAEGGRLEVRTEQRSARTGMSTWGALLFGIPFVLAGIAMALVGADVIHSDPQDIHAPHWVLTAAGVVFVLCGVTVWGMACRQYAAAQRRLEQTRLHPDEPAFADYSWDASGFAAPRWSRAVKAVLVAGFMTLFLSIFNWWAFFAQAPWMVKAIVCFFDAALVVLWWQAAVSIGRALKFGGSRILYEQFPYRPTEPVVVRWQPATGITRVNKGSFTLRCVEEWFERRGSGRNSSTQLRHEGLWSGSWHLDEARTLESGEEIELRFELPADARSTRLNPGDSAERAVFWELEAKLDLPGLDFEETYLVPIYSPR